MGIEEGSIPGALGRPMVPSMAAFAGMIGVPTDTGLGASLKYKAREAESFLRGPYYGALHNMQTYLIMSHDNGKGRTVLDNKDQLRIDRSEEHTSELQSLMRNSYAVFCLKKKNKKKIIDNRKRTTQ